MIFRFSDFELEVKERRLSRAGELIPLRAKVFDTLCVLVENPGRLLRKDELMKLVWPDSIVEENNLDHNISKLRRALGDGVNGNRFIETVPRQGYRFIAQVHAAPLRPTLHSIQSMSEPEDDKIEQEIKSFTTADGVRIAYAISGDGPPMLRAVDWINHLEFEWSNPFQRRRLKQIAKHHTLIRYDQRGSGLSDWNVADFSFERSIRDMEELVEHLGLDSFDAMATCQGAPIATAYAIRHPERVKSMILVGPFARGWPTPDSLLMEQFNALLTLIRLGWGKDNPAFRQLWTTLFMPDATREEMDWMNELQRMTASPENAVRLLAEFPKINILDQLPNVCCPTLVVHSRDDAVVPASEGRLMASRIRGARFVELDSRSHIVGPSEPEAWGHFVREVSDFLGWEEKAAPKKRRAAQR